VFLESSRYYKQKVVGITTNDGRAVKILTLRKPSTLSNREMIDAIVKGNDRLDIIAQTRYGNPTMFWYIADANTELQANDLLSNSKKTNHVKTIKVPEK
jgi:hypothetical protein